MEIKKNLMFEQKLQCPYCRQAITILLETGAQGYTSIVEDCEVCCRPIEVDYYIEDGEVTAFSYNSIDGNEF